MTVVTSFAPATLSRCAGTGCCCYRPCPRTFVCLISDRGLRASRGCRQCTTSTSGNWVNPSWWRLFMCTATLTFQHTGEEKMLVLVAALVIFFFYPISNSHLWITGGRWQIKRGTWSIYMSAVIYPSKICALDLRKVAFWLEFCWVFIWNNPEYFLYLILNMKKAF